MGWKGGSPDFMRKVDFWWEGARREISMGKWNRQRDLKGDSWVQDAAHPIEKWLCWWIRIEGWRQGEYDDEEEEGKQGARKAQAGPPVHILCLWLTSACCCRASPWHCPCQIYVLAGGQRTMCVTLQCCAFLCPYIALLCVVLHCNAAVLFMLNCKGVHQGLPCIYVWSLCGNTRHSRNT